MAQKPETKLRTKIVKGIEKTYGVAVRIFHPHGSQFGRNALDIVGCLDGRYFELEVKVKGGPTAAQAETIRRVLEAGGISGVVHNLEEALDALEG